MKNVSATVLSAILFFLVSCKSKQDIPDTKWIPLSSAVSYTLEEKGEGPLSETDSINVDLFGVMYDTSGSIRKLDPEGAEFGQVPVKVLQDLIRPLIVGKIPRQSEGYVRFNFSLFIAKDYSMNIFLQPGSGKADVAKLLSDLRLMKEIRSADHFNKEEAIKKYGDDKDSSWKRMLEENPLPESMEVYLNENYISKAAIVKLEETIKSTHPIVSDIQYPLSFLDQHKRFFVFILRT